MSQVKLPEAKLPKEGSSLVCHENRSARWFKEMDDQYGNLSDEYIMTVHGFLNNQLDDNMRAYLDERGKRKGAAVAPSYEGERDPFDTSQWVATPAVEKV